MLYTPIAETTTIIQIRKVTALAILEPFDWGQNVALEEWPFLSRLLEDNCVKADDPREIVYQEKNIVNWIGRHVSSIIKWKPAYENSRSDSPRVLMIN